MCFESCCSRPSSAHDPPSWDRNKTHQIETEVAHVGQYSNPQNPLDGCQVTVPEKGCRIIMASDGLWDAMSLSEVINFSRSRGTSDAASGLMRKSAMNDEVHDDCSVLVVDILPAPSALYSSRDVHEGQSTSRSESMMGKSDSLANPISLSSSPKSGRAMSLQKTASFANLAKEVALPRKSSSGFLSLFTCGAPDGGVFLPDAREEPEGSPGHVSTLSDADAVVSHPLLLERYQELSSRPGGRRSQGSSLNPSADSTQHSGMSAYNALQQVSASALRAVSSPSDPRNPKSSPPGGGWNRVAPVHEDVPEE